MIRVTSSRPCSFVFPEKAPKAAKLRRESRPFPSYLSCPSVIVNIPFLHGWTSFLLFVFHCFKNESNMRLELLVKRNKHVAAPEANSFTVQRAARWPLYEQNYICILLVWDINYIPLELSTQCAAGVIDSNIKHCIQYPVFLSCSPFDIFWEKFYVAFICSHRHMCNLQIIRERHIDYQPYRLNWSLEFDVFCNLMRHRRRS